MIWQDIVLTICQLTFVVALFPTIFSKDKPSFSTSLINTIVLLIVGVVNITLQLYGFAVSVFILAIAWGTLAVQKYLIDKKH